MHPEAQSGFAWAAQRAGLDLTAPLRVLDVGGQDVNGTVHTQFTHPDTVIRTLDLENADIIADATSWVPTELFDVVICTELWEHVQDWRAVIETMRTALDPAGPGVLLATCASTNRQPHGATGAPAPAEGEWYLNVEPVDLRQALAGWFRSREVLYLWPPGDAYAWGRVDADRPQVTLIIPTIPSRKAMLEVAVESARNQTLVPFEIIVEPAGDGEGPSVVRNRALERVVTEWVAFLDDDDYLHSDHLDLLTRTAVEHEADLCWSWFDVEGGSDPFPMHRGRQWDPVDPHQIPITVLVRTEAVRAVGGFEVVGEGPTDKDGNRAGEDFRLWLALSAAGYKFRHVDEISWTWRHHARNSSGIPSRR